MDYRRQLKNTSLSHVLGSKTFSRVYLYKCKSWNRNIFISKRLLSHLTLLFCDTCSWNNRFLFIIFLKLYLENKLLKLIRIPKLFIKSIKISFFIKQISFYLSYYFFRKRWIHEMLYAENNDLLTSLVLEWDW